MAQAWCSPPKLSIAEFLSKRRTAVADLDVAVAGLKTWKKNLDNKVAKSMAMGGDLSEVGPEAAVAEYNEMLEQAAVFKTKLSTSTKEPSKCGRIYCLQVW